jgi:hypothetical protein
MRGSGRRCHQPISNPLCCRHYQVARRVSSLTARAAARSCRIAPARRSPGIQVKPTSIGDGHLPLTPVRRHAATDEQPRLAVAAPRRSMSRAERRRVARRSAAAPRLVTGAPRRRDGCTEHRSLSVRASTAAAAPNRCSFVAILSAITTTSCYWLSWPHIVRSALIVTCRPDQLECGCRPAHRPTAATRSSGTTFTLRELGADLLRHRVPSSLGCRAVDRPLGSQLGNALVGQPSARRAPRWPGRPMPGPGTGAPAGRRITRFIADLRPAKRGRRRRGRWASRSRSSIPPRRACPRRRAGSTRAAARRC